MSHNRILDIPNKEYYLLVQLDLASDILLHCRDMSSGTLFDDLRIVSDLDKARLCLTTALAVMSQKLKEPAP